MVSRQLRVCLSVALVYPYHGLIGYMKICLSSLTGRNKRSLLLVMVLGSSQNSKWNMSVVDNTWHCAVSLQQHGFLVCSETLCHLPSPISVKNMLYSWPA